MANRILILEDDETFRKFVSMLLTTEGYDVVAAGTITEARQHLVSQKGDALCAIVDVVLDHESGIDFAQELIKAHPKHRVLLISGFTDDILMTKPEDIERIAFLRKPFGRPELVTALKKLAA